MSASAEQWLDHTQIQAPRLRVTVRVRVRGRGRGRGREGSAWHSPQGKAVQGMGRKAESNQSAEGSVATFWDPVELYNE